MEKGQAERLMPLLEEVLAKGGAGWRDLAALAVGTGPGNFTGVRIAVAAARGLALGLNVPAIGVTRFAALAHGQPRPVAVIEDARRGEAYAQEFGAAGGSAAQIGALDSLSMAITAPCLAGSAACALAVLRPGAVVLPPLFPIAVAIGREALLRLATPQPRPAPFYLRGADAAPPSDPPPVILDALP